MALQKFSEDVNNVSNLADKPIQPADDLKAVFDKAGVDIKSYINTVLTEALDIIIENLQNGKIDTSKIVNNLTTEDNTKVASASMVKKLNDEKLSISDANTRFNGKADASHTHTKSQITDFTHTHDDRYYTTGQVDSKVNTLNSAIAGKASSSHTHTTSNISGIKSGATTKISSGTANPSGGDNGDVYIQYF